MSTVALVLAAALAGAATPAPPTRWVEDHAAFLSDATRATLDARLESYDRETGHQVIVWIGSTLQGAPLDDWAVRTFEAWKLGRKGADDGLAMFIFAEDRTIDIEVGYGLEGVVPDAVASRIVREVMAPRIRAGDHDGAVTAGVDAVLAAIEGRPWSAGTATTNDQPPWVVYVLGGLAAVGFLLLAIKYPRAALWIAWAMFSGGRGGGGGPRRGGGGRSGGGGARGGW